MSNTLLRVSSTLLTVHLAASRAWPLSSGVSPRQSPGRRCHTSVWPALPARENVVNTLERSRTSFTPHPLFPPQVYSPTSQVQQKFSQRFSLQQLTGLAVSEGRGVRPGCLRVNEIQTRMQPEKSRNLLETNVNFKFDAMNRRNPILIFLVKIMPYRKLPCIKCLHINSFSIESAWRRWRWQAC